MMYQRIIPLVTLTVLGGCPAEPVGFTAATKPAWEAYYACLGAVVNIKRQAFVAPGLSHRARAAPLQRPSSRVRRSCRRLS